MTTKTGSTGAIALPPRVIDLIEEYEAKLADLPAQIKAFNAAHDAMNMAATVRGTYVEQVIKPVYLDEKALQANLLKSGWRAVMQMLQIDRVATANDRQRFERDLQSPPPLTMPTALATFRDYLERPRFHALRGLAEVFSSLDPAYRSHEKVKIGVKGLPKRVILSGFGSFHNSHANNRLADIINALAAIQGLPRWEWAEHHAYFQALEGRAGEVALSGITIKPVTAGGDIKWMPDRDLRVKRFENGNSHLLFGKGALLDINRGLAEFYGDVLPDVTDDDPAPNASTALAKDLQFYWTPEAVAREALDFAAIPTLRTYGAHSPRPSLGILEPSCGEGHIMDVLDREGYAAIGYECHAVRASTARRKGHRVVTGNFLDVVPIASFDRVVMNPPFYGRHYALHVRHAMKFLKPGGVLVAVLPASARYDHGELQGDWKDLPVASFRESGTNVPTVLYKARA